MSDAQHVHVKSPAPFRRGGVQHGAGRAHPGVVAQDVNATVTIPGHISQSTDGIRVGHIARLARHPVTDLGRQAIELPSQRITVNIGQHHGHPLGQECFDYGQPYA